MKIAITSAAAVAAAALAVTFMNAAAAAQAGAAAPAPAPVASPTAPATAAPAHKHAAADAASSPEGTVAVVNGTVISRSMLDYYIKSATHKEAATVSPEVRSQLLDNLIRGQILAQQGQKAGLDKKDDIAAQVALARLQVLGDAEASAYLKDKQPTDAQLHAEYDAQIAMMPKTEYHARHILVASQAEAQQVIDQLKGGAKFEDLAKQKSTDSTKDQGGDLGWFAANTMVQPFASAVISMKKGDVTQTPVQTPFGWHVIELLDTREQTPPPFDSVKDRVQMIVQEKKVRDYQEQLLKTATVKKTL
jgi:peptidyl-prolyl cis-trans isomerase C